MKIDRLKVVDLNVRPGWTTNANAEYIYTFTIETDDINSLDLCKLKNWYEVEASFEGKELNTEVQLDG